MPPAAPFRTNTDGDAFYAKFPCSKYVLFVLVAVSGLADANLYRAVARHLSPAGPRRARALTVLALLSPQLREARWIAAEEKLQARGSAAQLRRRGRRSP